MFVASFFWGLRNASFFFVFACQKRVMVPGVLRETVETGVENRGVTDNIFRAPCMFCEEGLGKIKVSATLQDRPRADRCSVSCFYKNHYKPYIF